MCQETLCFSIWRCSMVWLRTYHLNSVEYGQSDVPTLYNPVWSIIWWQKMDWLLVVYISIFYSIIPSDVNRIFRPFRCGPGTCCTQRCWLSLWGYWSVSILPLRQGRINITFVIKCHFSCFFSPKWLILNRLLLLPFQPSCQVSVTQSGYNLGL